MAKRKIIIGLALIVLLVTGCEKTPDVDLTAFAQCLTDKGAVMYGAYWCPHCQAQKDLFGKEAFAKVTYVECDPRGENPNPSLCLAKEVKGYPTWIFADGTRNGGQMSLENLGIRSGCVLPKATPAE